MTSKGHMQVKEGMLALMLCVAQSEMNAVGLRKLSVCVCVCVCVCPNQNQQTKTFVSVELCQPSQDDCGARTGGGLVRAEDAIVGAVLVDGAGVALVGRIGVGVVAAQVVPDLLICG